MLPGMLLAMFYACLAITCFAPLGVSPDRDKPLSARDEQYRRWAVAGTIAVLALGCVQGFRFASFYEQHWPGGAFGINHSSAERELTRFHAAFILLSIVMLGAVLWWRKYAEGAGLRAVLIAGMVAPVAASTSLGLTVPRQGDEGIILWMLIVPAAGLVFLSLFLTSASILLLGRIRRGRQANAAGMNLCAQCGYSLTGNVSGRCPECGTVVGERGATPAAGTAIAPKWMLAGMYGFAVAEVVMGGLRISILSMALAPWPALLLLTIRCEPAIVTAGLGLLLGVAAWALDHQRHWAAVLAGVWAGLHAVLGLANLIWWFTVNTSGFSAGLLMEVMILKLGWALAMPLLLVIWLRRPLVRAAIMTRVQQAKGPMAVR